VEIFRITRNAWGQETLEGISWDLLPVAFGLGVAFIIGHLVWRALRRKRNAGRGTS
jgi:hypothetical protein